MTELRVLGKYKSAINYELEDLDSNATIRCLF